jgi:hypothetical protein
MNLKSIYDFLENTDLTNIRKSISEQNLIAPKIIMLHYIGDDLSEYIQFSKVSPNEYLDQIEPWVNGKTAQALLFPSNELLFAMVNLNFLDGLFLDFILNKLSLCSKSSTFQSMDSANQLRCCNSLISKNKLKATPDFLMEKLKKNIFYSKIDKGNPQYGFGLKRIDDKILKKLGSKYSNYLELGYVFNQGDIEEFRNELKVFFESIKDQQFLAIIREDNKVALRLIKDKMNMTETLTIDSPFSDAKLKIFELI